MTLLILSVVLAGASISVVGGISFLGLIARILRVQLSDNAICILFDVWSYRCSTYFIQ